ncbi:MAG: metalloregulator ArsR/SmtB family transcription factor [Planctomycetota bacterium]
MTSARRTITASRACAERLKVLADPTRLAVISLLMNGPRQVGELNTVLGIDQSLLSHHLKLLRDAGMVSATRAGKAVRYALRAEVETRLGKVIDLGCCSISFE